MKIELNREELRYTGRIDMRNPLKPEFVFPASSLRFRFFGRKALVRITNRRSYWKSVGGAIVDGAQKRFDLEDEGETVITLLEETEDQEHDILLFKRMDACHEFVLEVLELSGSAEMEKERPTSADSRGGRDGGGTGGLY